MPIAPEILQSRTRIVVHKRNATSACADGRATALILKTALPWCDVREIAYDSPEHRNLVAEPGLIFGDFTPPKDRIPEFVAAGAVVLDHHDPKLVSPFGERGVWGDNAKQESGAALAYLEVFPSDGTNVLVEHALMRLAVLTAVRDTWHPKDPRWEEACGVSMALTFPSLDEVLAMDPRRILPFAQTMGPMMLRRAKERAHDALVTAVRFTVRGTRVAVISHHDAISDVAEAMGDGEGGADIVAAFEYIHEVGPTVRMVVHLRSRGSVNVQALAEHHGGGGHEKASGFSVPVNPSVMGVSPYEAVTLALEQALTGGAWS